MPADLVPASPGDHSHLETLVVYAHEPQPYVVPPPTTMAAGIMTALRQASDLDQLRVWKCHRTSRLRGTCDPRVRGHARDYACAHRRCRSGRRRWPCSGPPDWPLSRAPSGRRRGGRVESDHPGDGREVDDGAVLAFWRVGRHDRSASSRGDRSNGPDPSAGSEVPPPDRWPPLVARLIVRHVSTPFTRCTL